MARAKFGSQACPVYVRGVGVTVDEVLPDPKYKSQIIATRIDLPALHALTDVLYDGKTLDLAKLREVASNPPLLAQDAPIQYRPVDLAYLVDGNWVVREMKLSGDLDSTNLPGNIRKLAFLSALIGPSVMPGFSLLQGEAKGSKIAAALQPSLIYGATSFWAELLPDDVDYAQFDDLFAQAASVSKAALVQALNLG